MSRTYRYGTKYGARYERRRDDGGHFRCRNCSAMVAPPPSGGRHRNHCPLCLYSRHVDGRMPGDRASRCGGMMEPSGVFERPRNGEQVLVHRCRSCGFERYNRVAADDNVVATMRLPLVTPRLSRRGGLPRDGGMTA